MISKSVISNLQIPNSIWRSLSWEITSLLLESTLDVSDHLYSYRACNYYREKRVLQAPKNTDDLTCSTLKVPLLDFMHAFCNLHIGNQYFLFLLSTAINHSLSKSLRGQAPVIDDDNKKIESTPYIPNVVKLQKDEIPTNPYLTFSDWIFILFLSFTSC